MNNTGRITVLFAVFALVFTFAACGSSDLSSDEAEQMNEDMRVGITASVNSAVSQYDSETTKSGSPSRAVSEYTYTDEGVSIVLSFSNHSDATNYQATAVCTYDNYSWAGLKISGTATVEAAASGDASDWTANYVYDGNFTVDKDGGEHTVTIDYTVEMSGEGLNFTNTGSGTYSVDGVNYDFSI